jgi:hypothetical protein
MKNKLFYLSILLSIVLIPGCFLSEYRPPLKYTAPPGAYFVKSGMTRESRLQDFTYCGSHNGLRIDFTDKQREKASKAINEFIPGKNNDGYFILLRRLDSCMKSKGYHELPWGTCEGNDPKVMEPCMYP